jgi:outer membrane protein assembly factor BamD
MVAAERNTSPVPSPETPGTARQPSAPAAAGNSLQMRDLSNGDTNVNGAIVGSDNNESGNNGTAGTGNNQGAPINAVQPPAGTQTAPPPTSSAVGGNGNPPIQPGGQPTVWPSAKPDNGGLPTVSPKDNTPLPAATSAAPAPAQVNDVPANAHPVNTVDQNAAATGKKKKKKNPKPKFKGKEESSSTHKKKKGLHKLNPF